MDEQEEKLLKEANALRARELDVAEKRTAAILAIGRASLVTLVAVAAAWWGVGVLDLPWGRAMGWVAAFLMFLSTAVLFFNMDADDDFAGRRLAFWVLVLLGSVFVAGLTWAP